MDLFRKYPVVPPSNMTGQEFAIRGRVFKDSNQRENTVIKSGGDEVIWKTVEGQKSGGVKGDNRIVRISFQKVTVGNEAGALTFLPSTTGVPIYFLPWGSLNIYDLTIPDVGRNLYDPDDPANPGLFFTAAINGCSVFVKGSPNSPQVFHAGITGEFSGGKDVAPDYWRAMVQKILLRNGTSVEETGRVREVNKRDYVYDGMHGGTTKTAIDFEQWLKGEAGPDFKSHIVSPWGCVFGIRYGRTWAFYLQENATVTTFRYVKKKNVEKVQRHSQVDLKIKGTNQLVQKEVQHKKFGLIKYDKSVYVSTETVSRPIQIREFFPTGNGLIQIKDDIKRI